MPARSSRPAQDHTGESLFGHSEVTEMPDAAPSRVYRNQGSGLSEASGLNYAAANGLRPDSSPSGGPRTSSKSATYPWTADTAIDASKVKRHGTNPID
jgi:hypothetical protein